MGFRFEILFQKKSVEFIQIQQNIVMCFIILNGSLIIRLQFDTEIKRKQNEKGKKLEIDMC
jgi:hypothetical protein